MIVVSMRSPLINPRRADLVTGYVESRKIDCVVPLVGCATYVQVELGGEKL